ncbi:DNAJB9 DnaJ subfamily B member 9 [Candida maltosa Xu316]
MINSVRLFSQLTHYQVLGIPPSSSLKEIKLSFRKLSKKYHPDLHQNLSEDERNELKEKYVKILASYEVLKDVKKKKEYDRSLGGSNYTGTTKYTGEGKYSGEARYYSRSGKTYTTASGLNTKRHKIKYHNGHETSDSKFSGEFINYGDRYNVPHFDYEKHLQRNLKFEQHLINKKLDQETQHRILQQMRSTNASEELKTKHLLRHVKMMNDNTVSRNAYSRNHHQQHNHHQNNIYQKPESDVSMVKLLVILGGAGSSIYLLYKSIF